MEGQQDEGQTVVVEWLLLLLLWLLLLSCSCCYCWGCCCCGCYCCRVTVVVVVVVVVIVVALLLLWLLLLLLLLCCIAPALLCSLPSCPWPLHCRLQLCWFTVRTHSNLSTLLHPEWLWAGHRTPQTLLRLCVSDDTNTNRVGYCGSNVRNCAS